MTYLSHVLILGVSTLIMCGSGYIVYQATKISCPHETKKTVTGSYGQELSVLKGGTGASRAYIIKDDMSWVPASCEVTGGSVNADGTVRFVVCSHAEAIYPPHTR